MYYVTQHITTYAAACAFIDQWRPWIIAAEGRQTDAGLWLRLRMKA
jgi:hypothetical protein